MSTEYSRPTVQLSQFQVVENIEIHLAGDTDPIWSYTCSGTDMRVCLLLSSIVAASAEDGNSNQNEGHDEESNDLGKK